MTVMTQPPDSPMAGDRTARDIEDLDRAQVFEDPGRLSADQYPRVRSISAGHIYQRVPQNTVGEGYAPLTGEPEAEGAADAV